MSHKLAAKFTTLMATLRDRREAGATGLEYAGMVLVAAFVVGALYTAVKQGDLEKTVGDKVKDILKGPK